MAWNKPSEAKVEAKGRGGQSKVYLKGILAGAVAVVVGVVCIFMFSGKSEKPVKDAGTKPAKIKEVTPAKAPTNNVEVVDKPVMKKHFWEVDENHTNGFTRAQQRKWEIMRRPRMPVVHVDRPKEKYEIFEHHTENELAFLLTLEPGTSVIGSPSYKGYKEDFVQSCVDKIEIKDDDDEYTKNLKQAVIDAKKEILQRVKAGEDFVDIMKETREEMRKLAGYKNMLSNELREMVRNCETDADVDIAIEAANKMLESKGIAPLKKSSILRSKIKHIKEEKQ